jgi:hypothetical protein
MVLHAGLGMTLNSAAGLPVRFQIRSCREPPLPFSTRCSVLRVLGFWWFLNFELHVNSSACLQLRPKPVECTAWCLIAFLCIRVCRVHHRLELTSAVPGDHKMKRIQCMAVVTTGYLYEYVLYIHIAVSARKRGGVHFFCQLPFVFRIDVPRFPVIHCAL